MTSRCTHGDAIVAHFLDGDRHGGNRSPGELATHLAECGDCQDYLARGRRLDALVAASTDIDVDPRLSERLLASVEAAVLTTVDDGGDAAPVVQLRSRRRRALQTGALLLTGFAAAMLLQIWRHQSAPELPVPAPPESIARRTAAAPAAAIGPVGAGAAVGEDSAVGEDIAGEERPPYAILLPSAPGESAAPRRRQTSRPRAGAARPIGIRQLARLAGTRDLELDLLPMVALRAQAFALPLRSDLAIVARASATEVRLAAVTALAISEQARATTALVQVTRDEPAGPVLERMALAMRRAPALSRRLHHELERVAYGRDRGALLEACALVGAGRLDICLRDAVAGDVAAAERVAQASARVTERPGRIPLLLAIWGDLQARGLERDDATALPAQTAPTESAAEARARRWFAALPAGATAELIGAARGSRHAEQRRRCLLALASRADSTAIDYLLEVLHGRRLEESRLAAHALGRLPRREVAPRLRGELRRCRHPELLLAALSSSGEPSLLRWLEQLDLSPEELRFLRSGAFNLEDFAIAAALFRNRQTQPTF